MDDNVCCPLLTVLGCGDTADHKHLACDAYHVIEDCVMSNERVKEFCLGDFKECKYYPKGEATTTQEEAINKLAKDLEKPRAIRLLADWIAIDKGETRLQGGKYIKDATELYDYLIAIGFHQG